MDIESLMKNSENYIIRDYKKGDEEGITDLFKNVFEKVMTIEQWKWKYLLTGYRVYSKIVEDPSGKIVGHAGAIPLRGVFQKKLIQFFQIADVMIHPKARGYLGKKNVFDSLMKTLFEDIAREFPEVFCYGFPGTRPYIFGKRVRVYDRIEQAVECINQLQKSRLNLYSIKRINWTDNRLDGFWEKLSDGFSLSLVRDKDYLYWRYAANPFSPYQIFGFFLFGKLKGWGVIREQGENVFLVDLLTERKRCRSVLKALENYLLSQGKKTIRLWRPESWMNNITGYSEKETEIVVTNMVWKLPIQTSFARYKLYYTMGDADIF